MSKFKSKNEKYCLIFMKYKKICDICEVNDKCCQIYEVLH